MIATVLFLSAVTAFGDNVTFGDQAGLIQVNAQPEKVQAKIDMCSNERRTGPKDYEDCCKGTLGKLIKIVGGQTKEFLLKSLTTWLQPIVPDFEHLISELLEAVDIIDPEKETIVEIHDKAASKKIAGKATQMYKNIQMLTDKKYWTDEKMRTGAKPFSGQAFENGAKNVGTVFKGIISAVDAGASDYVSIAEGLGKHTRNFVDQLADFVMSEDGFVIIKFAKLVGEKTIEMVNKHKATLLGIARIAGCGLGALTPLAPAIVPICMAHMYYKIAESVLKVVDVAIALTTQIKATSDYFYTYGLCRKDLDCKAADESCMKTDLEE